MGGSNALFITENLAVYFATQAKKHFLMYVLGQNKSLPENPFCISFRIFSNDLLE